VPHPCGCCSTADNLWLNDRDTQTSLRALTRAGAAHDARAQEDDVK